MLEIANFKCFQENRNMKLENEHQKLSIFKIINNNNNNNNNNNKLIFYEEASNHPEVVFRRVL